MELIAGARRAVAYAPLTAEVDALIAQAKPPRTALPQNAKIPM
jgi:hypothetical protein